MTNGSGIPCQSTKPILLSPSSSFIKRHDNTQCVRYDGGGTTIMTDNQLYERNDRFYELIQ